MTNKINSKELLINFINESEGKLLEAYSAFHNFSIKNIFLATSQCADRNILISPLRTFRQWKELGYSVKAGEKAISLSMPVVAKKKITDAKTGEEKEETNSFFVLKPYWFASSQTDAPIAIAKNKFSFEREAILRELEITEETFAYADGNAQGYAKPNRIIAINPFAQLPEKTFFHEVAHTLLGHTDTNDTGHLDPYDQKEIEAESVALICVEALGLNGAEYCRGYIKGWLFDNDLNDKLSNKLFGVADKILKANAKCQLTAA